MTVAVVSRGAATEGLELAIDVRQVRVPGPVRDADDGLDGFDQKLLREVDTPLIDKLHEGSPRESFELAAECGLAQLRVIKEVIEKDLLLDMREHVLHRLRNQLHVRVAILE